MDLMTIAKKIFDDATDTISNIVELSQYYPVVSKGLMDHGDKLVSSELDRIEALIRSFPNGLTIQVDNTAVNMVISKSLATGKYIIQKDLNTRFTNACESYDGYVWFVEKVIKADCGTEPYFYELFTTTYEIDSFDATDARMIWEYDENWWESSQMGGSDEEYILDELIRHYSATEFNPEIISTIDINTGLVTKFNDLTDMLNSPIDIDEVFDKLTTCIQVQNILKLISEQVLLGHHSKNDLISILTTCKNSYTNKGAEVLEYFLNTLQGSGTLPFITALYNVYTSMAKTKVSDQTGSIEFYNDNYITEFAFNTVIKGVLPTITTVVSAVLSAIVPIAGGIIYGLSTLATTIFGAVSNLEEVSINNEATNRCFGYPINQNVVSDSVTSCAFATYAKNKGVVTVTTPIFCYSAWLDDANNKIMYESFPIVSCSKTDLEYVIYDILGYKRDMENASYTYNSVSLVTVQAAWKELSIRQNVSAYEYMSTEDQLWCLVATFALINLLCGDVNSAFYNHTEYYDDSHGVLSMNYILTHPSVFNTWNKMYDLYKALQTDLASSILNDKPQLYHERNWWFSCDIEYITSENVYDNPLSIMDGCFWDRDSMYAKPPKFSKGSILLTCLAIAAAAAVIAITALVIKRKIETAQRRKYAEINAKQSALQDKLKETDPNKRPSTREINAELNSLRKDTKRYNKLAKLTGVSTLSYFSGWENGDADTRSFENVNGSLESLNSTDEGSIDVKKLIRGY